MAEGSRWSDIDGKKVIENDIDGCRVWLEKDDLGRVCVHTCCGSPVQVRDILALLLYHDDPTLRELLDDQYNQGFGDGRL